MIPDEKYKPWLEGHSINMTISKTGYLLVAEAAGILPSELRFAYRFQLAHDKADRKDFAEDFLRGTYKALTDFDYAIPAEIAEVAE